MASRTRTEAPANSRIVIASHRGSEARQSGAGHPLIDGLRLLNAAPDPMLQQYEVSSATEALQDCHGPLARASERQVGTPVEHPGMLRRPEGRYGRMAQR
jgi:hypothetical protein